MKKRMALLALSALLTLSACAKGERGASGVEDSAESARISSSEAINIKDLGKLATTDPSQAVTGKDGRTYYKTTGTFYDAFDTIISVTLYTETPEAFKAHFEFAKAEYERLHKLYDQFHTYEGVANIAAVNAQAGKAPVKIDGDLMSLLRFSIDHYDDMLGKTNIAMGVVLNLWHEVREAAGVMINGEEAKSKSGEKPVTLPTRAELEAANAHTDIRRVKLDEVAQTVFVEDERMSLDLGSVAKGYATELVAKRLKARGVTSGLISAGGNVKTIGLPVDGRDAWSIGIHNPKPNEAAVIAIVKVGADMSMVTSGDYQRYFIYEGRKYHHIIDPNTLEPGGSYPSVTILTADSGLADMLSTAMFLSDAQASEQIRERMKATPFSVIRVDHDNKVTATEDLKDRLNVNPQ